MVDVSAGGRREGRKGGGSWVSRGKGGKVTFVLEGSWRERAK